MRCFHSVHLRLYVTCNYWINLVNFSTHWLPLNSSIEDRVEKSPGPKTWTLTNPVPLNTDGSSIATLLGSNPEVHYIYVCTKVSIAFQIFICRTFISLNSSSDCPICELLMLVCTLSAWISKTASEWDWRCHSRTIAPDIDRGIP